MNKVYHAALEKYKTYVLTTKWINSALSVTCCTTEDELLSQVTVCLRKYAGLTEKHYLETGVILPMGFFATSNYIFYHGFHLELNEREYLMLILMVLRKGHYFNARQLTAFCFPDDYKGDAKGSTASSVYRINKTTEAICGARFLAYSRKYDGYSLNIRVTKEI